MPARHKEMPVTDFFSSGWHWFIAGVTVLGLVFCIWLLLASSKTTAMSDDGTTGHVWDEDLREMNNPLPRWWLGLFVITVLFAAVYLYLYPGLGGAQGSLKWSQEGQWHAEQQAAHAKVAPLYDRFTAMGPQELAQQPEALAIGQRANRAGHVATVTVAVSEGGLAADPAAVPAAGAGQVEIAGAAEHARIDHKGVGVTGEVAPG